MKKLVIVLAAIAVSVAAHAATVAWGGAAIAKQADTDDVSLYNVYLFDATVTTSTVMSEALAKGDLSLVDGAKVNTATAVAQGDMARWQVNGWGDYAAGTTVTWYSVVFNNSLDNATHFMVTKDVTAMAPATGALTVNFGSLASNAWNPMVAVPEPTSGLLMLVGLGALALRRRRA